VTSTASATTTATSAPTKLTPKLVAQTPHDPGAFTQGLVFANGAFLEGTGQYGESTLRRVDPFSGKVTTKVDLPANMFGEGIARQNGEVFELTWREHTCIVYDEVSLKKTRELTYEGEGWGITNGADGLLVTSDGSATLRFRDPKTFKEVKNLTVKDNGHAIENINELELVRGEILANVWTTKTILRIDPSDGHVIGYLDLSGLPEPNHDDDPDAVLNGIAFDEPSGRLWVTGKRWKAVYEIAPPK
jgi:glutamine cyclotransferase